MMHDSDSGIRIDSRITLLLPGIRIGIKKIKLCDIKVLVMYYPLGDFDMHPNIEVNPISLERYFR